MKFWIQIKPPCPSELIARTGDSRGSNLPKSRIPAERSLRRGSIYPEMILDGYDVAVCRREFNRSDLLNTRFRGLDLSEYSGKTLDDVYPYVACATVTDGGSFWADCLVNLTSLHRKFHYWYGDQEAIRNIVGSGKYRSVLLPESIYGCLPEYSARISPGPSPLHFKGPGRKPMMLEYARRLKIL